MVKKLHSHQFKMKTLTFVSVFATDTVQDVVTDAATDVLSDAETLFLY